MSTDHNNAQTGQPCANEECNFTGHAGFENYCSVCYKSKVNANANAKPSEPAPVKMDVDEVIEETQTESKEGSCSSPPRDDETPAKKVQKNKKRCFECRKKVGILGFECRCGFVYCGTHRYPEEHHCEFDHATFDKNKLANSTSKVEAKKVDVL